MSKRFKSKKRKKINITIILFLLAFLLIFYCLFFTYTKKIDEEDLSKFLINYNFNQEDKFSSATFLIKYALGNYKKTLNELEVVTKTFSLDTQPLVYIYNTHQTEEYYKTNNFSYNINPTVLLASYMLKEYLNNFNIDSIVEKNDISEILTINNWEYKYSYKASRILMENAKEENPSLTYFLDIHRDSLDKNTTTTTINLENYAKILFVIGKDHDNYLENYNFALFLNNYLDSNYQGISRGISLKTGVNCNGIYNQDFSSNTILIEIGGPYNTISEVNNTIKALAEAINNYIGESYDE